MGSKYLFIKNDTDFSLQESERLVRLPLFYQQNHKQTEAVVKYIESFYF